MRTTINPPVVRKTFTLRIDVRIAERIRAEAARRGTSINKLAEAMLRAALDQFEKDKL